MPQKRDILGNQLAASNSTVAPNEGSESFQVKGSNPSAWGVWERLVPEEAASDPTIKRMLEIHLARYQTAASYVSGKRVLDIACGTGYGSQMLRLAGATSVVGVDLSAETIRYAKHHYQTPGVEFLCADAENFEWPEQFDVIVSFETMEHLHHPKRFLERLYSLLVPGGKLVLSVPLGETRHFDSYHLHAFTQEQVFALVEETGFSTEHHRCDDCFCNRFEMLRFGLLHPDSIPPIGELLFTRRGWQLIHDFVIQGGLDFPQLLVVAQGNPPSESH